MSEPQLLSALNLVALQVHQYEEYEDPGYFPGQFNGGLFHSNQPERYPLNSNIAMIINVPLAYTFYALPIMFPRKRWLGLAPVLFGFGQAVGHGWSSIGLPTTATAPASSPRCFSTSRSAGSTCARSSRGADRALGLGQGRPLHHRVRL
jgi:hypothetical protein